MGFLIPIMGGIGAGAATAGSIGTTAAVAAGLGSAALLGQGVSSYNQGKYNSKVLQQQAESTQIAQQMNEKIQRRQFNTGLASNRAAVGASGIEFSGSPLEVEINNIFEFEQDLLAQRYNANVQSAQARSQAKLARMGGNAALGTSLLKAGAFTAGKLLQE